eukprot:5594685-Amphidinium_carterae.1
MNNRDFIRAFTMWRDESAQYEGQTQTAFPKAVKVPMLLNKLSGPTRSHLLLNVDMRDPDFDAAKLNVVRDI